MDSTRLFYFDRNEKIQIYDYETIPTACPEVDSASLLFLELLGPEHPYLALDHHKLRSGRMVLIWNFDASFAEGNILRDILLKAANGIAPPTLEQVLALLLAVRVQP